jgi:uncharacterized protein YdeI (YjbR/CyaY-like superfamily)
MNTKVDDYISKATKWQAEIIQLRTLLLQCGLTEEFKWRALLHLSRQKCFAYW